MFVNNLHVIAMRVYCVALFSLRHTSKQNVELQAVAFSDRKCGEFINVEMH